MFCHDFSRSVYHHLFQGDVFLVWLLGEAFLDALHNATLNGCGDVYLADTVVDAGLEVLHARAATAVKHQRQAVGLVYLDEPLDIQLWSMDIMPVQVADGNSQSINTET